MVIEKMEHAKKHSRVWHAFSLVYETFGCSKLPEGDAFKLLNIKKHRNP